MTETGYAVGEAAILTLVQGVTGFTLGNAARGKWGILNTGKATRYAILKPGEGQRSANEPGTVTEQWSTVIEVWHRYLDDGTTLTNLEADVDAIIAKLDKSAQLGDTSGYVLDSDVTTVGECQEMWKKGGGVAWLRQSLTVRWWGKRSVSYS